MGIDRLWHRRFGLVWRVAVFLFDVRYSLASPLWRAPLTPPKPGR
jgi:hypothetical protein